MTKGLHIIGSAGARPYRDRHLITYRNHAAYLTARTFEYLIVLAHARSSNEGWVYKEDLEPGFNQARYLYRLKSEVKRQGVKLKIENNRLGYYRLRLSADDIQIEWGGLLAYPHAAIVQLARQQTSGVPA